VDIKHSEQWVRNEVIIHTYFFSIFSFILFRPMFKNSS